MCINAYIYIYIHTCTYIYIYTCPHTYTHAHIYTHTYEMYICTHASTSETTAREARLDAQKLRPSPCTLQCGGGLPFGVSSPIACQRGTTDKRRTTTTNAAHHTITTAHHPDYIRLSALLRSHPVHSPPEQIHPVHSPPELPAWPRSLEMR